MISKKVCAYHCRLTGEGASPIRWISQTRFSHFSPPNGGCPWALTSFRHAPTRWCQGRSVANTAFCLIDTSTRHESPNWVDVQVSQGVDCLLSLLLQWLCPDTPCVSQCRFCAPETQATTVPQQPFPAPHPPMPPQQLQSRRLAFRGSFGCLCPGSGSRSHHL